jgi:hypothetical protein
MVDGVLITVYCCDEVSDWWCGSKNIEDDCGVVTKVQNYLRTCASKY